MKRSRGVSLIDLLVVGAICGAMAALVAPPRCATRERANQTRCCSNLKQIGLAAMQYGDDKRFLPHIAPITSLDGSYETNTSARCLRSFVFFNYLDNPEAFVCPSGLDYPAVLTANQRQDLHRWSWQSDRDVADRTASPIVKADVTDLPLSDPTMTSLSYGWTRRGYTSNTLSSQLISADKARLQPEDSTTTNVHHKDQMFGNHKDCMVAVAIDAHTVRITPNSDGMTTGSSAPSIAGVSDHADGYLGVLADE